MNALLATAPGLAARRLAVLVAIVAAVLATLVGAPGMSGSAEARAPEGYYRCWVSDHGWMWCKDV